MTNPITAITRTTTEAVSILFVSTAQRGGAESYMLQVIDGLGPGWAPSVAVIDGGPFGAQMADRGLEVTRVGRPGRVGAVRAIRDLRRMLRRDRPRVIHANGFRPAVISALASTRSGIPVVWFKPDFARDGRLARLLARRCRQVVGMSHAVLEVFEGRPAGRLFGVPAGVPPIEIDRERARLEMINLLGVAPGSSIITLSGRLCPGKGQSELIAISGELARRRDIHIAILGGEDEYYAGYGDRLRKQVADTSGAGPVAFLGHRTDAIELVAGSDLLVMPSMTHRQSGWKEGFGLVAAEAMEVGTPVVAYANGALPEVIGDAGLIVAEGDRRGLCDALVRALEDDALRAQMVDRGRDRVRGQYRLDRAVTEMRERYRAALGDDVPPLDGEGT